MGRILIWLDKPDSGIPDTSWDGFLDSMAAVAVWAVIVTVVLTVIFYTAAARRRKIYFPGDLFATYSPMYWIFLALPSAILSGAVCFWQYEGALNSTQGRLGVVLQIVFLIGIASALLSYLLIVVVPGFTPAKFRYRAAPYLHKRRADMANPEDTAV